MSNYKSTRTFEIWYPREEFVKHYKNVYGDEFITAVFDGIVAEHQRIEFYQIVRKREKSRSLVMAPRLP